jgi:pSer/pThr/pTyr-binding forkhead associated (FHA) protein
MSGAAAVSGWTVVVAGPGGQEVGRSALRPNLPVTIGRAPDCNIFIGIMGVARYHGRIELANGIPTYRDEPGAAGSLIDGDPVDGPTPLGERTLLEIGGHRITLTRARPAAAPRPSATPAAAADAGGIETLLDRHIQGVRLHRNVNQQEHQARSHKWEEDWKSVLANARAIKARYAAHPSFIDFAISKDDREVTIKLKEDSRRGYAYFCLSRAHPEGKYPDVQAVWLREVGREDSNFSDPLRGLEELMSRLAPRLA